MNTEEALNHSNEMALVYQAGVQGWKVRGLLWFSLAVCLGCLLWGYDLFQHYGLSPGDGGVLRPLAERLAWGGFVAGFGLVFAIGMLIYAHIYINQVWLDEARQQIVFETIRVLGSRHIYAAPQDVIGSQYRAGELSTLYHDVLHLFILSGCAGMPCRLFWMGRGN